MGESEDDRAFLMGRHGFAMHSKVYRSEVETGVDVFALSRVRSGEGGMPVVNRRTGEYSEITLADEEGFAEESHIAFFSDNVLAVISNGQGAPGIVRIQEYLTKRLHWGDQAIQVTALAPPEHLRRLRGENAYTRAARVKLPAIATSLVQDDPFYGDVLQMAEQDGHGPSRTGEPPRPPQPRRPRPARRVGLREELGVLRRASVIAAAAAAGARLGVTARQTPPSAGSLWIVVTVGC